MPTGGKQLDEQRHSVEFALPSWRNLAKLQTKFPALIGSSVSALLTQLTLPYTRVETFSA